MKIPLAVSVVLLVAALAASARAQTFEVNFARASPEPPLVKTKFGVYQTPLTTLPRLLASLPLLREAGIGDVRYEMGWGKPDVLAFDQIGGTPARPTYDFSTLDDWVGGLNRVGVRPLLAMGYDPLPLQTRTDWARWKEMPSDLQSWQQINRAYAARLRGTGAAYEIWNEPDIPEPNGKMFFGGDAQDYARLYQFAARGLRDGDPDAQIGGPAAAYDVGFLAPLLQTGAPLNFASIHAYDNYRKHVGFMRGTLKDRPDVPIYLTEYASFSELPPNGPQSRHAGAMGFFRDAKGMLQLPDLAKVYWAQWLDAGDAPGIGLVTFDGHRKAIFNAFEIYGMMPIDRNLVASSDAQSLDAMASSDAQRASVVIWNAGEMAQNARVNLNALPFANGQLEVFRIDARHASYLDNPASETLQSTQTVPFHRTRELVWNGAVPAQSVIYLQVSNAHAPHLATAHLATAARVGKWVNSLFWFADRDAQTYVDFDPRTATARLGMGDRDAGLAQIGVVVDDPARRICVRLERAGASIQNGQSALIVLFQDKDGAYRTSVRVGDGANISRLRLKNGRPQTLDLNRLAPPTWNRHRVILRFILRDAGRGANARWTLF